MRSPSLVGFSFAISGALAVFLVSLPSKALDDRDGNAIVYAGVPLGERPAIADLDHDGDFDVVMGSRDGSLAYYQRGPGGLFQAIGTGNPFANISVIGGAPALADLDNDGDADLIVGGDDGRLRYFVNTGSARAPIFSSSSAAGGPPFSGIDVGTRATPSLADVDGDGDLDVLIGGLNGALNYFPNTGTALTPVFSSAGSGSQNPFVRISVSRRSAPQLADVDGDGDLDLLIGDEAGKLNYFANTGSAGAPEFTAGSATGNPFADIHDDLLSAPALADLDRDGDLDLVVGNQSGILNIFRNTGSATAAVYRNLRTGTQNPFIEALGLLASAPALADLDGDGDLDMVIGERNGTLRYVVNRGSAAAPEFGGAVTGADPEPFAGIDVGRNSTPVLGDLDGDGDLDLVIGEEGSGLNYFLNIGGATAPAFNHRATNPFAGLNVGENGAPALADLDGDGDLDLVVGERTGTFRYLRNTGNASAASFSVADRSDNPFAGIDVGEHSAPALFDLDGDGDLDLLAGDRTGRLQLFLNTSGGIGAAVFSASLSDQPFAGILSGVLAKPVLADLDNDGDGDLVIGQELGRLAGFSNLTGQAASGGGSNQGSGGGALDLWMPAFLMLTLLFRQRKVIR